MDLFNGLLCLVHVDLTRGLVWTGLMASLATFYGFYRWAGAFGVAGFLFNGGIAGFQFFKTLKFLDYQGDKTIAWKSIALSMFVTQRGLLYAFCSGIGARNFSGKAFKVNAARDRCPSGSSCRCTLQCHCFTCTHFSRFRLFWSFCLHAAIPQFANVSRP
jgi:hypothetical protein